jgi:glutaredoxin
MSYILFTATGCMRCSIAASYMDDHGISYEKKNIHARGKDLFKTFYRENRSAIFRGPEGIEFPILFTGQKVVQGVGRVLAFLQAGDLLDKWVKPSNLSHGWISGLDLSDAALLDGADFLAVVLFMKKKGLKIQLDTNGRNPHLLESLVTENGIDRLIFTLNGPGDRYAELTGLALDDADLGKSLSLINRVPAYKIILPVRPVAQTDGRTVSVTPEEAARAAALVERATGSKKHPFFIQPVPPSSKTGLPALAPAALFTYRTRCRRYMVQAEILTEADSNR